MSVEKIIAHESDIPRFIGFFHSTNGLKISKILIDKRLNDGKRRDGVIFFFYGQPSYTLKMGGASINEISFVFNRDGIGAIKSIAPFDTGGLFYGRYDTYFEGLAGSNDPDNILLYMNIPPHCDWIGKYIKFFFGGNDGYLDAKILEGLKKQGADPLLQCWFSMLERSSGSYDLDPPATTVEVKSHAPVMLSGDCLKTMILPIGYLDRSEIINFLAETGIKPITYEDEVISDKGTLWKTVKEIARSIDFTTNVSEGAV